MERHADDPGFDTAYTETVRAVSEQLRLAESLRTRAGLLLSVAAITASFLGSRTIDSGGPGAFAWLALAGFAMASGLCLAVLWPRRWEIAGRLSLRAVIPSGAVPGDIRRAMAVRLDSLYLSNEQAAEDLLLLVQLASIALAIDVFLWMIAIAAS